jgi:hypothetical protein
LRTGVVLFDAAMVSVVTFVDAGFLELLTTG